MNEQIRLLKADEIEVRVQQVIATDKRTGAILLLYKNARCDMAILDEVFGPMNWQREHAFKDGRNYCTVSIWDDFKSQWINKEDVGTESNMDADKGQASDAFKRACFNVGIGRELYTAPFIWVDLEPSEVVSGAAGRPAKVSSRVRFAVAEIEYNDTRSIRGLRIIDQAGRVRFDSLLKRKAAAPPAAQAPAIAATPSGQKEKRMITDAMLDDPERQRVILEWIFGAHISAPNPETFDAMAWVLKTRAASKATLDRLAAIYSDFYRERSAQMW